MHHHFPCISAVTIGFSTGLCLQGTCWKSLQLLAWSVYAEKRRGFRAGLPGISVAAVLCLQRIHRRHWLKEAAHIIKDSQYTGHALISLPPLGAQKPWPLGSAIASSYQPSDLEHCKALTQPYLCHPSLLQTLFSLHQALLFCTIKSWLPNITDD